MSSLVQIRFIFFFVYQQKVNNSPFPGRKNFLEKLSLTFPGKRFLRRNVKHTHSQLALNCWSVKRDGRGVYIIHRLSSIQMPVFMSSLINSVNIHIYTITHCVCVFLYARLLRVRFFSSSSHTTIPSLT